MYRRPMIIELLLAYGANPNAQDKFQRTPIQLVMMYWPRYFVHNTHRYMDMSKEEQRYNEYLARMHEKSRVCLELLCRHGADIVFPLNDRGLTALHLAARYCLDKSIDTFAAHRANLNVRDAQGKTPMLVAAEYGNFTFVSALLRRGIAVNQADDCGQTVLHHACATQQSIATIAELIECGAGVNAQDSNYGDTPLHTAAYLGYEGPIGLLLRYGADPDARNLYGQSATYAFLDNAANSRKIYGLERLLNETVQLCLRDSSGRPPRLAAEGDWQFREILTDVATRPAPLHRLCRQTLRKCIGPKNVNEATVAMLTSPRRHQEYVFYASDWTGLFTAFGERTMTRTECSL
ncbi:PREDICTED: ankyrin repeat domain-containing protein 61-like [Priapulus caudatus]|uniref:Ankyrin repeat domain-containing protein 61-like n=1 Tax=Priapulus caudatus TaxID=37621 RepID=A0ABM1E0P2_PRICU|nr:PREDICTED: ankyrin repeat domain-containing protein 61-like [Priapulus caudatus]